MQRKEENNKPMLLRQRRLNIDALGMMTLSQISRMNSGYLGASLFALIPVLIRQAMSQFP
jgi:hypothetical protein